MFFRLPAALVRAIMVIMLVLLPALLLPPDTSDGVQIIALVAIFAALFTIVEYSTTSPSLVEFRDAPPFNRLRFSALFATVFCLAIIFRGSAYPSEFTRTFQESGRYVGLIMDFPFSPVRLLLDAMPADADPALVSRMRDAAGLAYVISLLSVIWFVLLLRLRHWPRSSGAFNVWINLPTFDPTAGGDVVDRLNRDGRINVLLGFLLPFLIPLVLRLASLFGTPLELTQSQTLIWTVAAWAFLPSSILMRGVALTRVAQMIYMQRKKAYAEAMAQGVYRG